MIRIVKMTFEPEKVARFQELFRKNREKIRGFEGCSLLELYRDRHQENIFFTYSQWASEEALEKYRDSDLFRAVWAETKKLFCERPEAWSVDKIWSGE